MALDDSDPAKLTERMRDEITKEESIDDMVKPVDIITPADVEEETTYAPEAEETTYIKTAKAEE